MNTLKHILGDVFIAALLSLAIAIVAIWFVELVFRALRVGECL